MTESRAATESQVPVHERQLVLFLRFVGFVDLLALIAVAMPYQQMNLIHSALGLGTMPDEPVVGYLARSTSLLYAVLGGLALFLATDVRRYQPVIRYVSYSVLIVGIVLLVIDLIEQLPWFWIAFEGPVVVLLGLTLRYLSTPATGNATRG